MESIAEPPSLSDVMQAREPLATLDNLASSDLVQDLEGFANAVNEAPINIIPFAGVVEYAQQLANEELYSLISHLKSVSHHIKRAQLQTCVAIEETSARISCLEDYLSRREGIHASARELITANIQSE